MSKKIIYSSDLVISSTQVANALKGLDDFVSNLSVNSISRDELYILCGIVAAIACLSKKKHADDTVRFEEEGVFNEKE
ncbi:hypothetical protein AACA83_13125 [Enterococcus faecalis]|uniref:hypothetical protein n=1 Tax=Enterococcus faecalis TaxID=1351 RepID=UPI0015730A7A|nr:hypothetical protein [Enterococcus faecalis]